MSSFSSEYTFASKTCLLVGLFRLAMGISSSDEPGDDDDEEEEDSP
jgi:hypothetical protein